MYLAFQLLKSMISVLIKLPRQLQVLFICYLTAESSEQVSECQEFDMRMLCWFMQQWSCFAECLLDSPYFFLMTFLFCLAKRLLEVNFIELNITNLLKPFEERMPTVNEFYTLCINASSCNSLKFSSSICFGTKLYFKRLVRSM